MLNARQLKKRSKKHDAKDAVIPLLGKILYTPGLPNAECNKLKRTAGTKHIRVKRLLCEHLLFHKRANYDTIKLRVRKNGSLALYSKLIAAKNLDYYMSILDIAEVVRR